VAYGYDAKGRVSSVQTRASSAVSTRTTVSGGYAYEPFGAVKALALGNGLAVVNDWGNDGRLASRRLYRTSDGVSLSWLAYGYDADDNIGSITNQLAATGSTLYGYDKLGRLSLTVVDAASLGNETYAYTSGTNRLASLTGTGGTRSVTYDARGNTLAETRPGAVSATTAYDGYARLTGYTRSDAGTLSFAYNGLDDRVSMTLPASGTRRFVYDAGGRVIGEYGTSAADVKAEFVWAAPEVGASSMWGGGDGLGGYMPLAVATPDNGGAIQLNWVHGNHLGVPLVTTDATGALATTPNDYFAPGFPGQSRVLPDLYYNRYRDYDPATGRYVQGDPIGLGGGGNSYLYVGGNPISRVDPSGLIAPIVIAGVCWGGGCEAAGALILGALWYTVHPLRMPPRDPPRKTPAIPRGPTCQPEDEDSCVAGWMREFYGYCERFRGVARHRCRSRANDRLAACKHQGGRWPPPKGPPRWTPRDEVDY
jgi:RHS repeat-associated protein